RRGEGGEEGLRRNRVGMGDCQRRHDLVAGPEVWYAWGWYGVLRLLRISHGANLSRRPKNEPVRLVVADVPHWSGYRRPCPVGLRRIKFSAESLGNNHEPCCRRA